MHKEYTTLEIRERIENIIDPSSGKSLKEQNSIKHLGVSLLSF